MPTRIEIDLEGIPPQTSESLGRNSTLVGRDRPLRDPQLRAMLLCIGERENSVPGKPKLGASVKAVPGYISPILGKLPTPIPSSPECLRQALFSLRLWDSRGRLWPLVVDIAVFKVCEIVYTLRRTYGIWVVDVSPAPDPSRILKPSAVVPLAPVPRIAPCPIAARLAFEFGLTRSSRKTFCRGAVLASHLFSPPPPSPAARSSLHVLLAIMPRTFSQHRSLFGHGSPRFRLRQGRRVTGPCAGGEKRGGRSSGTSTRSATLPNSTSSATFSADGALPTSH